MLETVSPKHKPKPAGPGRLSSAGRGKKATEKYSSSYQCVGHLPATWAAFHSVTVTEHALQHMVSKPC